ncbi:MAG TPA: DUF2059 domain-containing protein [Roseiarcus sp.]|nr:DUF2059 domain-containing protein [Roseiarcus sp.]
MSVFRTARGLLLVATLFVSAGAFAADATAPAAAGSPSPAAVSAADSILGEIGVKQSIALIVPGMMAQLERTVTNTRPEIKDSLRETLHAIQPEFDKSAQKMYTQAAELLASQMSEKELQDVAAFFDSPSGKKYLAAEPVFLQKFAALAGPWREQLSTDMMARAREEMKKKGIDF